MRDALKGILERLLLHAGPAALSRVRLADSSVVLAYHNVVPDDMAGIGDASLHLPLSSLQAQLTALAETVEVIPLPDLLARASHHESGNRPRVAITFDDAYRGAVTLGLREVSSRGLSATMFVSPGKIGDESFWWDRYAGDADSDGLREFREIALNELQGRDDAVAAWAVERGWIGVDLPPALYTADERQLAEAAKLPGISLASHSWSHANLTRLDAEELRGELERPLDWLASRLGTRSTTIAYPYGLADERVAAAARSAGYTAGFLVEGGWMKNCFNQLLLPRLNVPAGLSNAGFRLRLAGLL